MLVILAVLVIKLITVVSCIDSNISVSSKTDTCTISVTKSVVVVIILPVDSRGGTVVVSTIWCLHNAYIKYLQSYLYTITAILTA